MSETVGAVAGDLRIALWQCESMPNEVEANLARLDRQAAAARAGGAGLLICPEMFLTGYAIDEAAVQRLAEAVDGPAATAVAQIATRHRIAIAHGYPERDDAGRVYNAARVHDSSGRTIGHCRKTHLYGAMDRAMFAPGDGSELVFMLDGWCLGLAICYDIEFPETARRLALQGADLIVVPTANMIAFDQVARVLVPARAIENQLYVAYANFCGREGALHYGGLSCVASPDAAPSIVAGRDETLLFADLAGARLHASRAVSTYLQDRRLSF